VILQIHRVLALEGPQNTSSLTPSVYKLIEQRGDMIFPESQSKTMVGIIKTGHLTSGQLLIQYILLPLFIDHSAGQPQLEMPVDCEGCV
jgi:hypothetical protein